MNRYTYPDGVRETLERLRQPLAVYQLIDGQVVTVLVSDGFCELLGYTDRQKAAHDMDNDMYRDIHPDDMERITAASRRFTEGGGDYEVVFRTKAGVESDYRVIHAHGEHVFTEDGIRLAQVWYMDEGKYIEGDEDSGTRMNRELNRALHEESILRAADYDALTGLPNLAHFFKQCETGKARAQKEGKTSTLLYVDLNGMKYYNFRNGFAEGDRLLKQYAELLAGTFGRENCCHIGADRFAAATVEEGLEERLKRLFEEADRMEPHLPMMAGIYSTGMEDVPVTTAYDKAKVACDSIRKSETSTYLFYSKDMSDRDKRRHYIQTNLDRAIAEKWIRVYCHAIVRAVNEKVCNEEALSRWIDPELGFLSPAEFIPQLEESGQIYKLDLYVLEQVLEKINLQKQNGMSIVPHSFNLSRSDFDSCDIVEEIRQRVDAAGVRRDLITIEVTESLIGSDFDYMKKQIERFRSLGFAVWLDDFGSGYSSLEVLQSIPFDLIKFDMSFMRRLDEGKNARIILTELVKMATSLGVETVCEGVETEKQVRFLQEIGCSKIQGFYYCKPLPYEEILERYKKGMDVGFEDTDTSDYFETIGRINLNDLDMITNLEGDSFQNAFSTVPIGIIEVRGDAARFVRSNESYREFMRRLFGVDMSVLKQTFVKYRAPFMHHLVEKCREPGSRTFYDETIPDGSVVHSFARLIGRNPKNGDTAIAVAVLSISDPPKEQ